MTTRKISTDRRALVIAGLFLVLSVGIGAPIASQARQHTVVLTAPASSALEPSVGCRMDVSGTAIIPPSEYVWVLVHMTADADVFVPQNEARVDPKTQQWTVRVQFGERPDIGLPFQIVVITVDKIRHTQLQDYRREAMTSGNWRPRVLPVTTSPPVVRDVRKTSHDC